MTITKWYFLRFDEKGKDDKVTKAHIAPASLVRQLLLDLEKRGCNVTTTPKAITQASTENHWGMVHRDRPWEDFNLSGLTFAVPSEEVLDFHARLQRLTVRRFERGAEYFKLHGVMNCIVLRPLHKLQLELQLHERIRTAEERAHVFYADKKPISVVLREAHANARGIPIEEVPELASDRHHTDRFIPKERGQA